MPSRRMEGWARSSWLVLATVLLCAIATGCASSTGAPAGSSTGTPPNGFVGDCPVTTVNGVTVPGQIGSRPGQVASGDGIYGNGKLAVALQPRIVVKPDVHDGSLGMKFMWWRGVKGTLQISGRRLDATAKPARGVVPDGYGDQGFQASGITFPTPGCWQVTGNVGGDSLTFVLEVVRAPD